MGIKAIEWGGSWITNIGNAFINLGSTYSIKEANSKIDIHISSRFTADFFNDFIDPTDEYYGFNFPKEIIRYDNIDYIIISGTISSQTFELYSKIIQKNERKDIKLILNGVGCGEGRYSSQEVIKTRHWLEKIKPYIFISRDEKTFNYFNDLAEHSYNGIDCAFFVNNLFSPIKLNSFDYTVLAFDQQSEPKLNINGKIVRVSHSILNTASFLTTAFRAFNLHNMKGKQVANKLLSSIVIGNIGYLEKENYFISDLPQDYLNLYANSNKTYSDRVHACIPTLAFGNPARLFNKTQRASLFKKVGAVKITEKLVSLNPERIKEEKMKQIDFLNEHLH